MTIQITNMMDRHSTHQKPTGTNLQPNGKCHKGTTAHYQNPNTAGRSRPPSSYTVPRLKTPERWDPNCAKQSNPPMRTDATDSDEGHTKKDRQRTEMHDPKNSKLIGKGPEIEYPDAPTRTFIHTPKIGKKKEETTKEHQE